MSEQPNTTAPEAPQDPGQEAVPRPEPTSRGRVRTEGETSVDDAIGAADDPR